MPEFGVRGQLTATGVALIANKQTSKTNKQYKQTSEADVQDHQ